MGRPRNTTPYLLKTKFPATCHCGAEIKVGDEALYYPGAASSKRVECRDCAKPTLEALDDERLMG